MSTVVGRDPLGLPTTRASRGMRMERMIHAMNVAFCKHPALTPLLGAPRVLWLLWEKGGK